MDGGRKHAAHLSSRHLLAPGGRSAVYSSHLRPFLARRLHGTLARQRLTPPGCPAVISFIYSLTLLTISLESDRIPELIMIHPSRPFPLVHTRFIRV
jgi:hypothetical protein